MTTNTCRSLFVVAVLLCVGGGAEAEDSAVGDRPTLRWQLDGAQLPAATRAAKMATAWNGLLSGKIELQDLKAAEVEVKTLPGAARSARIPVYLMNAAFVSDVDAAPICRDSAGQALKLQKSPAASTVPPSLAQVDVQIDVNPDRFQGADAAGELLLYTPNPVEPGSSVSHWATSASPNLLMEPTLHSDLGFLDLDLTPQQLQDIGWSLGTATLNITSLDPLGTGFTDPRPFAGAAGNPATTLGEARINLFNAVLGAWANNLRSDVTLDILVDWTPLECSPSSGAALAAATTIFVYANEGAFAMDDTWYPSALAEALVGFPLSPAPEDDGGDLILFVNSEIDEGCLGDGTSFYYGLDGNNPTGRVDLAPVVLHETAHGIGFANFTDDETGAFFQDLPGIYDHFTYDTVTDETWAEMATNAERASSATRFRKVTWNGPEVTAAVAETLDPGTLELTVTSPAEVAGTYEVAAATFGPPIADNPLAGELACFEDAVFDPTTTNGCSAAVNADELAGKIALIDRGTCFFTDKVSNAQNAGALGVVIGNDQSDAPFGLIGNDGSITIPAVSVGRRDAVLLRQAACGHGAVLNQDRFLVTAAWRSGEDFDEGDSGEGEAVVLTEDSAYFYFFSPSNVEVVVKVLDGCNVNGHFWFFAAGLTDVEVTLTVTDTQTGASRTWTNPLGTAFQPIQDTQAFTTCP